MIRSGFQCLYQESKSSQQANLVGIISAGGLDAQAKKIGAQIDEPKQHQIKKDGTFIPNFGN